MIEWEGAHMRRTRKLGWQAILGIAAMLLVLVMGFAWNHFSIVSHAQSQGKVTASSANIRKEPDSTSDVVGSAEKDAKVTINHQISASDGTVWYQIFVDADTLGYIRSDLVQITEGGTPPTTSAPTATQAPVATATPAPAVNETPAEVALVEPVSASVTNGAMVRVRSNASTTSSIVTTVANGSALTVTGQANGTDNKVWYQVQFIADGAQVTGFIRSEYVALSGELVPASGTNTEEPVVEEPEPTQEPVQVKDWETQLQGEKWYLLDMVNNSQYAIEDVITAGNQNAAAYEESQKTVKSQKLAIIILVFLAIALAAFVAYLIYKIKDMQDQAFFAEVERDTLRRRSSDKAQNGQKVMHTVGAEKRTSQAGTQGIKPQGTRSQGAQVQGARPQGTRPQGTRTQGAQVQGARPQGTKPQGVRPQTTQAQSARPQGVKPQGVKTVDAAQAAKVSEEKPQVSRTVEPVKQAATTQSQGWQSKNFMTDENDEFEFEFLNWNGDDDQ